jgi:putative FmdB family regulatory protein
MPTYEYECNLCRNRFDRRQRFDDEPVSICPQCQGRARRVFHAVPILFKGSGFYCTDHGRGQSGSASKEKGESVAKESAEKESAGTTSKASTESKTEDKKIATQQVESATTKSK